MRLMGYHSPLQQGCLVRIRQHFSSLRESESKVAAYIMENPDQTVMLSIAELAKKCGVSESTIVRFARTIGFSGFQELKLSLAQDLVVPTQFISEQISATDSMETLIAKVTHSNVQAIHDTNKVLDVKELERAVEAISKARKIEFYGVGFAGLVAQDAHVRLSRIGFQTNSYVDPHLQAHSAALLTPEDVAVGLSFLGKTKDIIYTLAQAKNAGATVISITKHGRNPVSELADIKLFTATEDKLFRTGASRMSQLHVIDVLYTLLAVKNYENSLACMDKTKHIGVDKRK